MADTGEMQKQKGQRSCCVCGKQGSKKGLLRVVRTPEGTVAFDPTGRAAGRGAYFCSCLCFAKAKKANRLDRALKVKLSENDYACVEEALAAALGSVDE